MHRKSLQERLAEVEAKIQTVEGNVDKGKDEYAKRALRDYLLELKSQADSLQKRVVEEANRPPEVEEVIEPLVLSFEQKQGLDNLQRQIQVAKMRNQSEVVTQLLRQMQDIAPDSPHVLELLGDEFARRNQWKQALEPYTRAHKRDPKNASLERKYANAVFRTRSSALTEAAVLRGDTSVFIQKDDVLASPKAAAFLSFMLPGAGQFVRGRPNEGFWHVGIFVSLLIAAGIFHKLGKSNIAFFVAGGIFIIMIVSAVSALKEDKKPNIPF